MPNYTPARHVLESNVVLCIPSLCRYFMSPIYEAKPICLKTLYFDLLFRVKCNQNVKCKERTEFAMSIFTAESCG